VKLHEYFDGLLKGAVNINATRLGLLGEHTGAIRACLGEDHKLAPVVKSFVPQGSWAHKTIIRPLPGREFDADMLVSMKRQRGWSDDPVRYLLALHEALAAAPRYRGKAELKTRCVRVSYAGDCHVDLVPYLHIPGWFAQDLIVNRRDNAFEEVNPAGFTDWMRGRDRLAHGNLRKTIRLLKYLRDYKRTFTVPSVILTVLAGERVNWWSSEVLDGYADLPSAFTRIVAATDRWLQARPGLPPIADPSCPGARFDHRLTEAGYAAFRDRFHVYAGQVAAALAAESREESVTLWRGVFGDAFRPLPG
jgi:Second Messenger Oligonucleotide or Dinucleotide Synthetase domain